MRYKQVIGGAPRASGKKGGGLRSVPRAATRRFPPVIQVVTQTAPYVEQQLSANAIEAFHRGLTVQQICAELKVLARSLGYEATIGVQEVYSSEMPSFPDQTIISALLIVDMRLINRGSNRFHRAA